MFSEKYIFCSAFTPEGWIEPQCNGSMPRTLVCAPPCRANQSFWEGLSDNFTDAHELFADPLAPDWLEGFSCGGQNYLLNDILHPRSSVNAPFSDTLLDLHCRLDVLPASVQQQGLLLLQRQRTVLQSACTALTGARAFLGENLRISASLLSIDAVRRLADVFAAEFLPPISAELSTQQRISVRFFSALTAYGPTFCRAALNSRADVVIALQDEYGAASKMILHLLHRKAMQANEDLCIGRCPFFWPDKIDHLLLEKRRILFTTENRYHAPAVSHRRIDCRDMWLRQPDVHEKEKMAANRRQSSRLLAQARISLRECRQIQAALASLCPLR